MLTLLLVVALPVWGQSASGEEPQERIPVELGGTPIFYFRVSVARYSPETRAKATSRRILAFARDRSLDPNLIKISTDDETKTYNLVFEDQRLATLTEADAAAIGIDPVTMILPQPSAGRRMLWKTGVPPAPLKNMLWPFYIPSLPAWDWSSPLPCSIGGCGWLIRRLRRWQGTRIPGFSLFGNELLSAETHCRRYLGAD